MRTLVAMVSTGRRETLTDVSFPRLAKWASRHDYSSVLIKEHLEGEGKPPHYAKLLVAQRFPDFDSYVVVDDDLLLNTHAPQLPTLPEGYVGLARDAEQRHTTNSHVEWTGNTGFVLFGGNERELLLEAYEKGDDPSIWGYADQGALNSVLWSRRRVVELDQRWNFAPVLTFFLKMGKGWEHWSNSRAYRMSYYAKVIGNPRSDERRALRACWGCHLIRAPYPRFFDRFVP